MLQCYQTSGSNILSVVVWLVLTNIRTEPFAVISGWPDKHRRAEKRRDQAGWICH